MKILLKKNSGYKWTEKDGVFFKGYIMLRESDETVYREDEAIKAFCHIASFEELVEFLKTITGVFAVIINKGDKVFVAVDRARAIPLYFNTDGKIISDCGDTVREELGDKALIDQDLYAELLANDYLIANNTVYTEIKQLDMGQACEIAGGKIKYAKYFYHVAKVKNRSDREIMDELTEAATNTFKRLKRVIDGRPVVLSMSGGYDSRFVGCMLKRVGVENVSCYTYGRKDSFEVKQSKKNAEALGFRWTFVEYSDDDVKKILDDVGEKYMSVNNNHDFTTYVQNFPAVRKLSENGWIKPGSVFITGLCGDMPTGNYLKPYDEKKIYNEHYAAEHIYELLFSRYKMNNSFKEKWIKNMTPEIEELPIRVQDYQSWVTATDAVYTGTCHSRLFMHMNDIHDFFGYEWLLPYWDEELLLTWYSIPAEKRIRQGMYEQWLLPEICKDYGLDEKKTRVVYSDNKIMGEIEHCVGAAISFLLLHIGIPFRRKYDINNFAPLELKLFQNIKDKRWVEYKKSGLSHLMNQYLLQKRYGMKIMERTNHKK